MKFKIPKRFKNLEGTYIVRRIKDKKYMYLVHDMYYGEESFEDEDEILEELRNLGITDELDFTQIKTNKEYEHTFMDA